MLHADSKCTDVPNASLSTISRASRVSSKKRYLKTIVVSTQTTVRNGMEHL